MKFYGYDNCFVQKDGFGDKVRYSIMSRTLGPITKINIVGVGGGDVIGVFNYSVNEGMLDFLTEQGVVKELVGYQPSGFTNIPLVRIDEEKLLAL